MISVSNGNSVSSNSVYRYENNFFIGNHTYDRNNLNYALINHNCRGIPYTHMVQKPNCLPIHFENIACVGFCSSITYPGVVGKTGIVDNDTSQCFACGPSASINKFVLMLCLDRRNKFRVMRKTVRVIERCKCKKYNCPIRDWNLYQEN